MMNKMLFKPIALASLIACVLCPIVSAERYIIKFKEDSHNQALSNLQVRSAQKNSSLVYIKTLKKLGAKVKHSFVKSHTVAADISRRELVKLKAAGVVESFEIDPVRMLIKPTVSFTASTQEKVPYGIEMVQADQVSDSYSANRKICIVDTGYSGRHEDLRPFDGDNISGDDNAGQGSSTDSGDWFTDGIGHGTHVAGTISGIGGNGIGIVGVNPSNLIGLHIVKVFTDSGFWAYGSDIVAAIEQCTDAGANVISISVGGLRPSNAEENAFQKAFDRGVLAIASSGNQGSVNGNDALNFPASYPVVMSVGSVDQSKLVASDSQKNHQVEISAPGVSIRSTGLNDQYKIFSGTSMAVPHVSGVAALVWSHFPNCNVSQIRKALIASAEDQGEPGRDQSYGYGIVKAKDTVDYLAEFGCGGDPNFVETKIEDDTASVSELTNGTQEINISVQKGKQVNFFIDIPKGVKSLTVSMSGGYGDADLDIKAGSEPTKTEYDCRPYITGNNENCSFGSPEGRYFISIKAHKTFSGVTLKAVY